MLRADTAVWAAWNCAVSVAGSRTNSITIWAGAHQLSAAEVSLIRRIEVDDDARAPSTARQRGEDDDGPPVSCVPVSGFVGGGGVGLSLI